MADTPPEGGPARSDETAKLELPSLNPFRRRRRHPEPVAEPEASPEPDAEPEPVAAVEPTWAPEPAAAPEPEPVAAPAPEPEPVVLAPEAVDEPVAAPAVEPPQEPGQRKAPRARPGLPTLPGVVAALLGGLVVGAFGAGLTWVSLV